MSNSQLQTCETAIKILRGCPYDHPYRAIRLKYAEQIELQSLVGDPEYDDVCVSLSLSIINAAQQNAHPTLGESVTSQAVSNTETLSTSDGVPPSTPARVA